MVLGPQDLKSRYSQGVAYAAQQNLYAQGLQNKAGLAVGSDVAQRWAQRSQAPGTADKWFNNMARGLAGGGGAAPMAIQR